ncbi:hypothetical protein [Streptomyces kaniharaensis]|uniref:hypothetical protein n=1 Tax=Streptomyces kaniharaensis TaxID=212423 RepID=UPI0012958D85|nr:hypothetical protein [Streptomyces kaniharaensis]
MSAPEPDGEGARWAVVMRDAAVAVRAQLAARGWHPAHFTPQFMPLLELPEVS